MMESTPPRDNRDIIIDATLFSDNLAEVRNRRAKVFGFVLFISVSVVGLKTTFSKMITKNYTTNTIWSIRILLRGLVSTNMHVLMYGNETCKVFTNVYFVGGHVPNMMRSVRST